MKNSLVLLGMAMLVFNTTTANISKTVSINTLTENEQDIFSTDHNPLEKRNFAPVEDNSILNPVMVINHVYQKSVEEIIAENNQIIESTVTDQGIYYFGETPIENVIQENNQIIENNNTTEVRPLYLDKTIEDQIAEDNAIIEGSVTNVETLDFETINKKAFTLKQNDTVGMN